MLAAAVVLLWIPRHPITAKGQYDLGVKYENGDGVPKDDAQAVTWFRKAAEQGDADASVRTGHQI
jgi:TPR repeat protein